MKIQPVLLSILLLACQQKQDTQHSDTTRVNIDSTAIHLPSNLERPAEEVALKYIFKKGEVFGYSVKTIERVTIQRDTLEERSEQTVTYRYTFEVMDVRTDGSATLKATCLGVVFKGDYEDVRGRRSMEFNSDEKNEKAKEKLFSKYNAVVNTPFDVSIGTDGQVESVGNLEPVLKRLLGDDYATVKFETKKILERDYGEGVLKGNIQDAFQRLPLKPIATDSSWSTRWAGDLGYLKLEHEATFTLKGFEPSDNGRLAHIAVQKHSRHVGEKYLDTGQGKATVERFDVKGWGSTVFNVDLGRSGRRTLKESIQVKLFVEPPQELKQLAPDQARDFIMIQTASIERDVVPLPVK